MHFSSLSYNQGQENHFGLSPLFGVGAHLVYKRDIFLGPRGSIVLNLVDPFVLFSNHQIWWFLAWFNCRIAKFFANTFGSHSDYICFFFCHHSGPILLSFLHIDFRLTMGLTSHLYFFPHQFLLIWWSFLFSLVGWASSASFDELDQLWDWSHADSGPVSCTEIQHLCPFQTLSPRASV